MKNKSKAEVKACLLFATLASIFVPGVALIGGSPALEAVGWAMAGWVAGFVVAVYHCD